MNPIIRNIARGLVILAALLVGISMLAQLTGCHVTRAFNTAEAPAKLQPVHCSNWDECA